MNVDPYVILELPRGAPEAAVRQAFRKLALRYHPDRNPGDVEAEARFKLISAAYQRLKVTGFRAPATAAPRPSASAPPPRWSGASSEDPREDEEEWAPPPRPEFWPDGQRVHYPTQREIDDLSRRAQHADSGWSDRLGLAAIYLYFGVLVVVAVMGVRGWLALLH